MTAQMPSSGTVTPVTAGGGAVRSMHCDGLRVGVVDEIVDEAAGQGQCRRVFVDGELDMATVGSLESILRDAPASVCVDLSGLTFCDVAGLNALLTARERAVGAGHGFVMIGAPAQLRQLLHMTATWENFTVEFGELPPRPVPVAAAALDALAPVPPEGDEPPSDEGFLSLLR